MSKTKRWSNPELIVTVVIALASLVLNIYQYRSSTAASLIGELSTPRTAPVTATLDSDSSKQLPPAAKLIRFDNVSRGVHELLIQGNGFHPTLIRTSVSSPEDNWITHPIELTSSANPAPQPASVVVQTVGVAANSTGADPFAELPSAAFLNSVLPRAASASKGWVYLGQENAKHELTSSPFDLKEVPNSGASVSSDKVVPIRNSAPGKPLLSDYYRLGEITTTVPKGGELHILETKTVGTEGHVWARVETGEQPIG